MNTRALFVIAKYHNCDFISENYSQLVRHLDTPMYNTLYYTSWDWYKGEGAFRIQLSSEDQAKINRLTKIIIEHFAKIYCKVEIG